MSTAVLTKPQLEEMYDCCVAAKCYLEILSNIASRFPQTAWITLPPKDESEEDSIRIPSLVPGRCEPDSVLQHNFRVEVVAGWLAEATARITTLEAAIRKAAEQAGMVV